MELPARLGRGAADCARAQHRAVTGHRRRHPDADARSAVARRSALPAPDTYAPANAALIDAQAGIPLAQVWGDGMVAAVDGVRFVVPVRSIDAPANPKYLGCR